MSHNHCLTLTAERQRIYKGASVHAHSSEAVPEEASWQQVDTVQVPTSLNGASTTAEIALSTTSVQGSGLGPEGGESTAESREQPGGHHHQIPDVSWLGATRTISLLLHVWTIRHGWSK